MIAALSAAVAPADEQPLRPRVAIIDSGVARTPELASVLVAEYDMASNPPRPAFKPHFDHGTMVATILARSAGYRVEIVSLRIDDPAGCPAGSTPPCQPSGEPVARAIRHAADLGVDAINISLALGNDAVITDAVRYAGGKGIPVILAAGNQGLSHPANLAMARAAYPSAVLVGAIDGAGSPWSGTNRPDAEPEGYNYVWHFGVNVPTSAADGRPVTATGTSFAAPIETARLLTARASVE
ncbi:S8 family peptidase [Sphingomonas xinjiangensis]|uniref:S8 family peptidase n=1 Tax=Sphingomonas xinjiangensis TaxID=643568 RepID=UPI001C84FE28